MKIFVLFLLTVSFGAWTNAQDRPLRGAPDEVTDTKTRARLLKIVNDHLCSFKGCWELVRVEKFTKQIVAGSLYKVTAIFEEVMEEKFYRGEVKIWEQPWMNFLEVTFKKGEEVRK